MLTHHSQAVLSRNIHEQKNNISIYTQYFEYCWNIEIQRNFDRVKWCRDIAHLWENSNLSIDQHGVVWLLKPFGVKPERLHRFTGTNISLVRVQLLLRDNHDSEKRHWTWAIPSLHTDIILNSILHLSKENVQVTTSKNNFHQWWF